MSELETTADEIEEMLLEGETMIRLAIQQAFVEWYMSLPQWRMNVLFRLSTEVEGLLEDGDEFDLERVVLIIPRGIGRKLYSEGFSRDEFLRRLIESLSLEESIRIQGRRVQKI